MSKTDIRASYEAELDRADIIIVILDGVENKSWTGFECGYARAKGKYIYGITGASEGGDQQHLRRFEAMCDELIHYSASDDVATSLGQISHDLSSRVMVQTS